MTPALAPAEHVGQALQLGMVGLGRMGASGGVAGLEREGVAAFASAWRDTLSPIREKSSDEGVLRAPM